MSLYENVALSRRLTRPLHGGSRPRETVERRAPCPMPQTKPLPVSSQTAAVALEATASAYDSEYLEPAGESDDAASLCKRARQLEPAAVKRRAGESDDAASLRRQKRRRLRDDDDAASLVSDRYKKRPREEASGDEDDTISLLSSKRRRVDFRDYSSHSISLKYDPSIVYALDELLTRGQNAILAKFAYEYINATDIPGSVVVVGYDQGARCAKSHVRVAGDECVPLVLLDSHQSHPIFQFKRATGYPIAVILITWVSSRLGHDLSCDGKIEFHPRDTVSRSTSRFADALNHTVQQYLQSMFYDENRRRGVCTTASDVQSESEDPDQDEPSAAEDTSSTAEAEAEDPRRGMPMSEAYNQNLRLFLQGQTVDQIVANRSHYPDEYGGQIVVEKEV